MTTWVIAYGLSASGALDHCDLQAGPETSVNRSVALPLATAVKLAWLTPPVICVRLENGTRLTVDGPELLRRPALERASTS